MEAATPKPAENKEIPTVSELDSVSEQMQQVRTAAVALLDKADSAASITDMATAVEKATGALKLAAEMGKARTELTKINEEITKLKRENETTSKRERYERTRDYVALLAPWVTVLTTVITGGLAFWQFQASERDKREEALDAQWQNAVKMISTSGALSPGVVALQPFLRSPNYREQAVEVAVNLLASSSDPAFFSSLFSTALVPVTWNNMDRMLRLDREVGARMIPLISKSADPAKRRNDMTRLEKDEIATYNYADHVVAPITAQIGGVLKTPRPPGAQVDLSSTYLRDGDWKAIDFGEADLTSAYLIDMDLKDAELKGVTQFGGTSWWGIAWWEVKSISQPLLKYLETNYPFDPNETYGPQREVLSKEEYDAAITRLTSQSK